MAISDLNALLAQVVRAAGEAKCKGQPGVAYKEVTWGCDDGYEVVDGAVTATQCSVCNGTCRPPLAQAVWEACTVECPCRSDSPSPCRPCLCGNPEMGWLKTCELCHGTGRVPLTIPVAWPEQWARDAVCGGLAGVVTKAFGTEAWGEWPYALAEALDSNDAPGALRALLAAVKGEAGQ